MKYIDAEKLIAEINNRLMSVNLEELGNFGCHRVWAYNDVKDLITSLQQEQPMPSCKSCGFYENNCPYIRGQFMPYPKKVCKDYAYSVMQEQPSLPSELDEAAHEFEDKVMNDYEDICVTEDGEERPVLKYNFTDAFKAGAKWMAGKFAD